MILLSTPTRFLYVLLAIVSALVPVCHVRAGTAAPSIIITEVQTGAVTAGDEFIELYNTTDVPVDITGWQIRYRTGTTWTVLATVRAPAAAVEIAPGSYYVLASSTVTVAAEVVRQIYTAGLSKTDKTVALFAADTAACGYTLQDAVGWTSSLSPAAEGRPVLVPPAGADKDKLLQRYQDAEGRYVATGDNTHDFALQTVIAGNDGVAGNATPGTANGLSFLADQQIVAEAPLAADPIPIDGCEVSSPGNLPTGDGTAQPADDEADERQPPADGTADDDPAQETIRNDDLLPPSITELLPNPKAPQTDAADEFIELYNPNDAAFELGGYTLEAGTATMHRFTFPAGTRLAPKEYRAFFAAQTSLSLSNGGGRVRLVDPAGTIIAQTDLYGAAPDGQAWVLQNGVWQWSVSPTPNTANVVTATQPASKKTAATAKKTAAVKAAATKAKTAKITKTKSPKTAKTVATAAASSPPRSPMHGALLAAVGVFAVLYGAYEYRHDLANKYLQLRSHRAARRAARQGPEGR